MAQGTATTYPMLTIVSQRNESKRTHYNFGKGRLRPLANRQQSGQKPQLTPMSGILHAIPFYANS
jgi:hypothetical protein